ncbi:hypothetical protein Glove_192g14 [Diversispora epigaea]|uniref:Uncharacterized protein n=1 Tax=Diversispora epigaea TaxID=1348612 RepID=A0A397IPU5_9GLOM|nr:hypothetical protein Glove_192g14 [Diversispora epigaea]
MENEQHITINIDHIDSNNDKAIGKIITSIEDNIIQNGNSSYTTTTRPSFTNSLDPPTSIQQISNPPIDSRESTTWENEEEIDEGVVEKVFMAINIRKRKLGCAYYVVVTSTLYLMEDIEESSPYDIVNLLRYQIKPSVIITSSRADESFIQMLQSQDDTILALPVVEIRPGAEFVYASAKTKLFSIRLANQQMENNKQEIYLQLSSILNMESVETVNKH